MDRLRLRLAALTGRRRAGLAGLCGLLATAALPPFHAVPLLVPAFVGLVWLLAGAKDWRAAFWIGWCFGFVHFTSGLYWISNALLINGTELLWLVPIAAVGLPVLLSLFVGAGSAFARALAGPDHRRLALALPVGWSLSELARGHLFTGFPWNLLAHVWAFDPVAMQTAALFGTYGLGLVTALAACLPAALDRRHLVAAVLLVSAGAGYGWLRVPEGPVAEVPDIRLRLVQPAIPQQLRWHADRMDENLLDHVRMSLTPTRDGRPPTHVIWGETAAAFFVNEDAPRRAFIGRAAPPGGALITGTLRSERDPRGGLSRAWNSLVAIDGDGRPLTTYDKFHLVPFGEYIPFRWLLDVSAATRGLIDFTPGPGPRTVHIPGLPPVSPLICYEVIFPGAVTEGRDTLSQNRHPLWLLNLTNDGWYGFSTGPFQHFAISRFRSVEEGLPLVRVANTGISGIVDPYGRVIAYLPLQAIGFTDGPLPTALVGRTVYATVGNAFVVFPLFALTVWLWGRRRRKIRSSDA